MQRGRRTREERIARVVDDRPAGERSVLPDELQGRLLVRPRRNFESSAETTSPPRFESLTVRTPFFRVTSRGSVATTGGTAAGARRLRSREHPRDAVGVAVAVVAAATVGFGGTGVRGAGFGGGKTRVQRIRMAAERPKATARRFESNGSSSKAGQGTGSNPPGWNG